ncbi:hypothetical protein LOD99_3150 [Oopsacas minuta]|uniref:Flavin-containing monooxygenase n=1 Tax=Oopsacas minuta TaxID=111878 RepID=A0AAV7K074_9METZ|nr:hypothetical protein LOD99_3150 [Oopsacas minuta]
MSLAIIGAGACGLVGLKEALSHGLKPVCFEIDCDIGGLWNIDKKNYSSSVYNSTIINTSKEMMCFSDFPMPRDFPAYCPHHKVLEYFRFYCENFGLREYIAFKHRVELVEKSDDYEQTGDWKLTITNLKQQRTYVELFNFVLVCNGHHGVPHIPHISGRNLFKGKCIHSQDYFKNDNYVGKSVVIIGVGNSGCDMAVDMSRVCKKVYLVTRKGAWIFPRLHNGSLPFDMQLNRFIRSVMPRYLSKLYIRSLIYKLADLDIYGLTPDHDVLTSHPTVNDDLIGRIAVGSIVVKPNIRSITETGVQFIDNTSVDADVIAYCTGYSIGFPFLASGIINTLDNNVELYKYVFPPHLKGSLAILGCVQPLGAINPIAELQARWVMMIFNKVLKLPTQPLMEKDIKMKREKMSRAFTKSRRHTIQVDYQNYSDEISNLFDAKPRFLQLLFEDPRLFMHVLFGPLTPSQYRLFGPQRWPQARNSILNCWKNTKSPTQTRVLTPKPYFLFLSHFGLFIIIGFFITYLVYICFT